jgi:hypothetical protein
MTQNLFFLNFPLHSLSDCIEEELPPATELEENLRNGVYLAKIARFCVPHLFSAAKIFDADQRRWREQARTLV